MHVVADKGQELVSERIRILAQQVAYGGRISVIFHDLTLRTDQNGEAIEAVEQCRPPGMTIKATWEFDWPSLLLGGNPAQHPESEAQLIRWQKQWIRRLQHAMVDRKSGWISREDAVPPGIPFMRALQKNNLTSEAHSRDVAGGRLGSFEFTKWGSDDSLNRHSSQRCDSDKQTDPI